MATDEYRLSLEKEDINDVLLHAATRPEAVQTGNFPLFTDGRALRDSGRNPDSYAAALVDTVGPAPYVSIYPDTGSTISLTSVMDPIQDGDGDPSPDNPRPIHGWTAVNLSASGKNLVGLPDISVGVPSAETAYMCYLVSDFVISANADAVANPKIGRIAVTYKSGDVAWLFDSDVSGGTVSKKFSATPENPAIKVSARSTNITSGGYSNIQVEYGTSKTGWEPYAGMVVSSPIQGIVYGGIMDWKTGVLTVTWKMANLTSDPVLYATNGIRYANALDGVYNSDVDGICNYGLVNSSYKPGTVGIGSQNNSVYLPGWLTTLGLGSLDDFKAWVAEHPIQIAYRTKYPIGIELSPIEVQALSGLNIISASGNIETIYNQSISAVIEGLLQRIAALESAATQI